VTNLPRFAALSGGVIGIAADVFLVLMYTLEPRGVRLGPVTFGGVNDVLTAVQFALLAPVVVALGRRVPPSRAATIATWLGAAASAVCALLGVLLVAQVMTFDQQIVPQLVTILIVTGWLLTIGLIGHRSRALPRWWSRSALLVATGLLLAAVLVLGGFALPGATGIVVQIPGYVVGGIAWLALPLLVLLSGQLLAVPARGRGDAVGIA
jgi:hypothetical protein